MLLSVVNSTVYAPGEPFLLEIILLSSFDTQWLCFDSKMEKDGISTFTELWRVHLQGRPGAPTERTLQRWNAIGVKFINLAAGGSLYMLVYLAGSQYLWPTEKLVGDISHAIVMMLRDPSLSGEPPLPLFQSSNLFLLLQRCQISSSPTLSLPLDTFNQCSCLLW